MVWGTLWAKTVAGWEVVMVICTQSMDDGGGWYTHVALGGCWGNETRNTDERLSIGGRDGEVRREVGREGEGRDIG